VRLYDVLGRIGTDAENVPSSHVRLQYLVQPYLSGLPMRNLELERRWSQVELIPIPRFVCEACLRVVELLPGNEMRKSTYVRTESFHWACGTTHSPYDTISVDRVNCVL
jgi:hypothetical protein